MVDLAFYIDVVQKIIAKIIFFFYKKGVENNEEIT